ncbi:MAG TPA: hypothetical protein VKB03_01935 [Conexibacter sp.]|nr:hypothetical protein [Conexibacter sp.]
MTRTTVDVDEQALEMARVELGTTGLSATVNAALRDVARRRTLSGFDAAVSSVEQRWLVADGSLA